MRALLVLSAAFALFASGCDDSPSDVNIPTDREYVVYDFWAPWCGPCKSYAPVFERLQSKYTRPNVTFKRVNVEDDPKTSAKFKVEGLPTVVVTADDKVIAKFVGGARESQFVRVFKQP